jgi:hypothetical protein
MPRTPKPTQMIPGKLPFSVSTFSNRAALIALLLLVSLKAEAQRGARYEVYEPSSARGPTSGFQGFFDTEQADEGTFTAELFSFAVDYGVTERWSLGTNGLTVLGLPFGFPGALVKSRYRFFETPQVVSALSAYAGGFVVDDALGYLLAATSNTSVLLSSAQRLGVSIGVVRLGGELGQVGKLNYANLKGTVGYAGVSYGARFTEKIGIEALIVPVIASSVELDSAQASLSIDSMPAVSSGFGVFGRIAADFRLSEMFLITPMLLVFGNTAAPLEEAVTVSPYLNMMFRFGAN